MLMTTASFALETSPAAYAIGHLLSLCLAYVDQPQRRWRKIGAFAVDDKRALEMSHFLYRQFDYGKAARFLTHNLP
jgi:hypothetical protein